MSDIAPLSVAFLLFPNVTQLDLTAPAQMLSRLGNASVHLVWKDRAPVPTDVGFSIVPTATFAELPAPDILCVPGGMGIAEVIDDPEAYQGVLTAAGSSLPRRPGAPAVGARW